jgi:recombination protein RecR
MSPLLLNLIQSLRCLPGIGPKSAQRMAFHILQKDRLGARRLIDALESALEKIGYCQECRMLTEETICEYCSNLRRDPAVVCVVEAPDDVIAIEASQQFKGQYFILMGHLSPLDRMGPEEIGMPLLEKRFAQGVIREVIIATNPTVEGEATVHYIADMARSHNIHATRIAHGVPMGGELKYVDAGTLAQALTGRRHCES